MELGPTHPVIATILAIGLVVVLIAVFCTHPTLWDESEELTPTVGAISNPYVTYEYSVYIEKIDPAPTGILNVRYILLDNISNPVHGIQGELVDILNLDFYDSATMISFQDNDRDERLSTGDRFLIKMAKYGGQASSGYKLLLVYIPTEDTINGGGTTLG